MIVWLLFHLHLLVLLNTQIRQWVRCESEVSAANINSFCDPGNVLVITDLTSQTHVDHVQQLFLVLSLVRSLLWQHCWILVTIQGVRRQWCLNFENEGTWAFPEAQSSRARQRNGYHKNTGRGRPACTDADAWNTEHSGPPHHSEHNSCGTGQNFEPGELHYMDA